ncbi:MAG: rod shape-determining protein MreC [Verrucomicrobium sp.]|nr:rod shape-determining protein MreC [Verrucomicrobium sp.]
MHQRLNVLLPAAVALLIAVVLVLPQNWKTELRGLLLDVFSPAIRLYDRERHFYEQVRGGFTSLDHAQKEAARLRQENAALLTENNVLRDLRAENGRLREMLGFKKGSQYSLLACRVVSRDPSNWWNTVIVNRGWTDNERLTSDLPVVTPRGVVG